MITQSMSSLISPCNASNCPEKRIPLPYLDCLPSHFLHVADEFSSCCPLPRNIAVMRSFAEKGANTVQSPREVAEASDVVITMLPSSPHVCSFPLLSLCMSFKPTLSFPITSFAISLWNNLPLQLDIYSPSIGCSLDILARFEEVQWCSSLLCSSQLSLMG